MLRRCQFIPQKMIRELVLNRLLARTHDFRGVSTSFWQRGQKFVQRNNNARRFASNDSDGPFDRQCADEVRVKEQTVKCIIGCNPDERDRLQDLVISVRLWTNLRESMSKFIRNCDVLETQQSRAASPDWASHAAAELAGTYNYSAGIFEKENERERGRKKETRSVWPPVISRHSSSARLQRAEWRRGGA